MSAILSLAVLVLAASFGSWALSQWLASRERLSHRGLAFAVGGVACLSAAVALGVYAVVQTWPSFTPTDAAIEPRLPRAAPELVITVESPTVATPALPEIERPPLAKSDDASPARAADEDRTAALKLAAQRAFHDGDYLRAAQLGETLLALLGDDADVRVLTANAYFMAERFGEAEHHIETAIGARLDEDGNPPLQWLRFQWSSGARLTNRFQRARVQQALLQNYPEHRSEFLDAVQRNLVVSPHDAPPRAEPRFVVPGPLLADWPTTECVTSTRARTDSPRLFLDNECERAVALVFASCPHSTPSCNASALVSSGWTYEADGVVLITPEQRPLVDRLTERGPLIAPVYALDPNERQRIRYLACPLTDAEALAMLREPQLAGADRPMRLRSALARDACYARVLELSRAGRKSGRSPDALLAGRA